MYKTYNFQEEKKQPKKSFFKRSRETIAETIEFSPEKKLIGVILLLLNSLMLLSSFVVSIINPFWYLHTFTINLLFGDIGAIAFYLFIYFIVLTKLIGINFVKPNWYKLNKMTTLLVIVTAVAFSMSIINVSNTLDNSLVLLTDDFIKDLFWTDRVLFVSQNKPWSGGEWMHFNNSLVLNFNYFGIIPIIFWLYPFLGVVDNSIPLIVSILMLLISLSYIIFGSWKTLFTKSYEKSLIGAQRAKEKGKILIQKSKHQSSDETAAGLSNLKTTNEMPMLTPRPHSEIIGRGKLSDSILNDDYRKEVDSSYKEKGMTYHESEMDKIDRGDFDEAKYDKYGKEYVDGTKNEKGVPTDEFDMIFADSKEEVVKADLNESFSGDEFGKHKSTFEPGMESMSSSPLGKTLDFDKEELRNMDNKKLDETLDLVSTNFKREQTIEKTIEEPIRQISPEAQEVINSKIKHEEKLNKVDAMFNKASLTPYQNNLKTRIEKTSSLVYSPEIFEKDTEDIIDKNQYFNKELIDNDAYTTDEFYIHKVDDDENTYTEKDDQIESFEETYEIKTEETIDETTVININPEEAALVEEFEPVRLPTRTAEVKMPHYEEESVTKKPVKKCKNYKLPSAKLLAEIDHENSKEKEVKMKVEVEQKKATLNGLLESFGVDAKVIRYIIGPRLINFEIQIGYAVKIQKITNLEDNIKLALAAKSLRIQAPVPGKNVVGIEIPHNYNETVGMRDVYKAVGAQNEDKNNLTILLGKDSEGKPISFDLKKAPHLLVAGATGSGKSVAINVMLISLLLKFAPHELKLMLVDPKMVEFSSYKNVPHLIAPIVSDSKKAALTLNKAVAEMEARYKRMAGEGVKNIQELNDKLKARNEDIIPYIVIVIDELADLMVVARKDVEETIMRLTQKARASGIHLILATQKPSTDVITGVIKANIPSRIAFTVSSGYDSRTIIDQVGAENLIGQGDMLISMYGSAVYRGQSSFVSNLEVDNVVAYAAKQCSPVYDDEFVKVEAPVENSGYETLNESDPDFQKAKQIVLLSRKASTSFLQRRMKIGYNKAANIIEALEHYEVIGPSQGSKSREIYDDAD